MKVREFKQAVKRTLEEINAVGSAGTGASFSAGQGEQYATPFAFGKRASLKTYTQDGYKQVKRPKHPSHTKMFDFLQQ